MGYRSDVVVAFTKEVIAKLQLENKLPTILTEADDIQTTKTDKYYIFDNTKWYEAFPEVIELTDLLNKLNYTDFAFIRVGEEFKDVEYKGDTNKFDLFASVVINLPEME